MTERGEVEHIPMAILLCWLGVLSGTASCFSSGVVFLVGIVLVLHGASHGAVLRVCLPARLYRDLSQKST